MVYKACVCVRVHVRVRVCVCTETLMFFYVKSYTIIKFFMQDMISSACILPVAYVRS